MAQEALRHALLPAGLAVSVLAVSVLAGCTGAAAEKVTFTVEGRTVQTGPVQYCDVELTTCEENNSAVAVLGVPVGQPVQISIPDSVAQTPWQVVFRYRRGGEQVGGRSQVFTPGSRQAYTLQVPEGGTLETLEVQQYGAPALAGGEPSFPIRAVWVLAAEKR